MKGGIMGEFDENMHIHARIAQIEKRKSSLSF